MKIIKITTNFVEIEVGNAYFGQEILHNKKTIGQIFETKEHTAKFETSTSLKLSSVLELGIRQEINQLISKPIEYNQIIAFEHIFFANLYPIPRGSIVRFADLNFAIKELGEIAFVTKLGEMKGEIILILDKNLDFEEIRKYQNLAGNYKDYSLTIFTNSLYFGAVASFDGFKMKNYHLENWLQKNLFQEFRNTILGSNCIEKLAKNSLQDQNARNLHTFAKLELIYNKIQELTVYVPQQKLDEILESSDLTEIIAKLEILTII